ncbi:hypothetical protein [uncultured Tateyamaria sp.]|nr:hypothetical protein [uncultured Tateyamaria sp.]
MTNLTKATTANLSPMTFIATGLKPIRQNTRTNAHHLSKPARTTKR